MRQYDPYIHLLCAVKWSSVHCPRRHDCTNCSRILVCTSKTLDCGLEQGADKLPRGSTLDSQLHIPTPVRTLTTMLINTLPFWPVTVTWDTFRIRRDPKINSKFWSRSSSAIDLNFCQHRVQRWTLPTSLLHINFLSTTRLSRSRPTVLTLSWLVDGSAAVWRLDAAQPKKPWFSLHRSKVALLNSIHNTMHEQSYESGS